MFHFTLPLKGCILIQNSQDTFSYESKNFWQNGEPDEYNNK
mgnify:CR=1 FL=1